MPHTSDHMADVIMSIYRADDRCILESQKAQKVGWLYSVHELDRGLAEAQRRGWVSFRAGIGRVDPGGWYLTMDGRSHLQHLVGLSD